MSQEKDKIFIPDTNFIIEHKPNFVDVLKILSKFGDVYMSQITIDERLAQRRLEIKKSYSEIEELSRKHKHLIDIKIKQSLEERIKKQDEFTLDSYRNW